MRKSAADCWYFFAKSVRPAYLRFMDSFPEMQIGFFSVLWYNERTKEYNGNEMEDIDERKRLW